MKNQIILGCMLLTFSPFACKKKDEPAPQTKKDLLTAKPWNFKSLTLNGMDGSSQVKECEKDDTQKFNSDGTYSYTDAGVKCQDPGDDTGTWKFAQNESLLVLDSDDTLKIEELTPTTFRFSGMKKTEIGNFKYESTLIAQ